MWGARGFLDRRCNRDGGTANARTDYDGESSVVIVTQKGDCERAYRAPITINNGSFVNVGVSMVDVSGKVGPDGKLTVG